MKHALQHRNNDPIVGCSLLGRQCLSLFSNIPKIYLSSPFCLISPCTPRQSFAMSTFSDPPLALTVGTEGFLQPRQPVIPELCVYAFDRPACSVTFASTQATGNDSPAQVPRMRLLGATSSHRRQKGMPTNMSCTIAHTLLFAHASMFNRVQQHKVGAETIPNTECNSKNPKSTDARAATYICIRTHIP